MTTPVAGGSPPAKPPRKPRPKKAVKPPNLPDIEIHLVNGDESIDNPSVPLRWCYPTTLHTRMQEGREKGHAYAVLMVLKLEGDPQRYQEVRELKDAGLAPFTFANFSRPGLWTVSFLLFERTRTSISEGSPKSALESLIAEKWLDRQGKPSWYSYSLNIPAFTQHSTDENEQILAHHRTYSVYAEYGTVITVGSMKIQVPEGIFAKQPAPWKRAYANYFFPKTPMYDQCDFRRRFYFIMLFPCFGFVPYLVWECMKRFGQFIIGLVFVLAWRKNSWWVLGRTFEPAINFRVGDDINHELSEEGMWPLHRSPYLVFLSPGALVLEVVLGFGFLWFLVTTIVPILMIILGFMLKLWLPITIVAILLTLIVTGIVLRYPIGDKLKEWSEDPARVQRREEKDAAKQRAQEEAVFTEARLEAERVERNSALLVCGTGTQDIVVLEAIPEAMRQKDLTFFAFWKRRLCRPFA